MKPKNKIISVGAVFLSLACLLSSCGNETYDEKESEKYVSAVFTEAETKMDYVFTVNADSVLDTVKYGGENKRDPFLRAYVRYAVNAGKKHGNASSVDLSASSKPYNAAFIGNIQGEAAASLLLQPDVIPAAPQTADSDIFDGITSTQLLCEALSGAGGSDGVLYAGSGGVALFYNDVADKSDEALNTYAYALITDGLPVKVLCASQTDSGKADGVDVLVIPDDGKYIYTGALDGIIKWIKNGGHAVISGGLQFDGHNMNIEYLLSSLSSPITLKASEMTRDMSMELVPRGNNTLPETVFEAESLTIPSYMKKFVGSFENVPDGDEIFVMGDNTVGVRVTAGEGSLTVIGVPTEAVERDSAGAGFVRAITAYTLSTAGKEYIRADAIVAERGDYLIVKTFGKPYTADGDFLEITGSSGKITHSPTVEENSVQIFYKLDPTPGETQKLIYTNVKYEQSGGDITVSGSSGSADAFIIMPPSGKLPSKVSVSGKNGREPYYTAEFDEKSGILTVLVNGESCGGEYTLKTSWGDTKTDNLGGYERALISVTTNNRNEDEEFLYFCNSGVHDTLRFADKDSRIVYKFDLQKYPEAVITLSIVQNYIIEISDDGENWSMIADYSQGGTVPHTRVGDNSTDFVIGPETYGSYKTLYVQIRNSDPKQGWGGSISHLSVSYIVKK